MGRIILAVPLVTIIIFVVPVVVYGLFSRFGLAEMPGDSLTLFLAGVLVSKFGTALAFVVFFALAPAEFAMRWPLYALIWFVMLAFGEIGQAIGQNYTWSEAVAGMISEAIYFALSAHLLSRLGSATATVLSQPGVRN